MIIDASKTDNMNNFISTPQSQSDKDTTALFKNTTDFIKLLTVQLQNQDPTKPMETDQLTQQIASLSQVEQTINTNKNLEKLMAAYTQSQVSGSVSYIGKLVEAPGNLGSLMGGKGVFVYNLEQEAHTVQVEIKDVDGNVVYTADGTKLAGRNQFLWNGKNKEGEQMKDGTYVISVKAKDQSGAEIKSETASSGRVTSVETIDGINYIALGDILVPLDKVLSVREMPTV